MKWPEKRQENLLLGDLSDADCGHATTTAQLGHQRHSNHYETEKSALVRWMLSEKTGEIYRTRGIKCPHFATI